MKKILQNLDEYVLMSMLSFSTLLIFCQVIMRYVFQQSLSWSEEMARYLYVWQTWIAASYAVKKRRHLRITSLVDKAHGVRRIHIELLVLVLWLGFSIFLCIRSAMLCEMIYQQEQIPAAMALPMWIPYLAVPVGTALMSLRLVYEILDNLRNARYEAMKEV